MKKVGGILIIFILMFSLVIAQTNGTNQSQNNQANSNLEGVEKAYQCLNTLISERTESELSLQEAIFSTLAIGSSSKLNSVIESEKGSNCWPKSSCTLKETAQVILANKRASKSTAETEKWLFTQNGTASELSWFIQIDIQNHVSSSCTLTYQGSGKQININEDMTITGNPGACLSISPSGFWLRIRDNCMNEQFRVSCDQDFVTSLLYQKSGSQTVFVSPETHSASSLGSTEEKVNSQCFKSGNSCDYEGTLWSALALESLKKDASDYLPYLSAFAEDNQRLNPNSILYLLTQGNDYYSNILQAQQQSKYWQAPNTKYNRFYDTSLSMLALQGTGAQELENAKNYLLSIQTGEGCWNNNNIRDTAFILYAGWPKSVSSSSSSSSPQSCLQTTGRQCVSATTCAAAGGTSLFDCDLGVCCSNSSVQSCFQQSGSICSASETCQGSFIGSSDSSRCCIGTCQATQTQNACQQLGGICDSSCQSNEVQSSASCDSPSSVCCISSGESSGSNIWFWIFLLLILIVLAIIAILFRKKLALLWFKLRNRGSSSGTPNTVMRKPPFPPYGPAQMRRPMNSGVSQFNQRKQTIRPRPNPEDKDFEETLKRLKEMGN